MALPNDDTIPNASPAAVRTENETSTKPKDTDLPPTEHDLLLV
jgi:hypothetical protein